MIERYTLFSSQLARINCLKIKTSCCIFDRKAVVIRQGNLKALGNESKIILKKKRN